MTKYPLVIGIAALVIGLDQLTKWYIRHTFGLYESIVVIENFFDIVHLQNTGGAFGLLAGLNAAVRLPFFITVALTASVALLYFVRTVAEEQLLLLVALGGILGGALGNLIDRARAGEVTDFLYFHWHDYYWPAFNVADSCISTGMVIVLLYSFFAADEAGSRESGTRPARS